MPTLLYRVPRTATEWYVLGGIVGAMLLMAVIVSAYHRRRRRKLAQAARELGLEQVEVRSEDAGYIHRPEPRQSRFTLELCAVGVLEGRAARMAEYTFATPSGKSHVTHRHLQVCLECPESWPPMRIADFCGIVERPAPELLWQSPSDAALPPAAADQVERLLSPKARSLLALGAKNERWDIADGWLACTWRCSCSPALLPALLERAKAVLGAMSAGDR